LVRIRADFRPPHPHLFNGGSVVLPRRIVGFEHGAKIVRR
jgi:hypothetical protein